MKIRIEMTAAEMMSVKSLATLFDDIPMESKKRKIEEITNHTKQTIIENSDGSYEMEFTATELITVTITNWMRDVIGQCKGLIFGCVDTFKNISSMMGVKKLIIDGEEAVVTNKIKIETQHEDVHIVASRYVDIKQDKKQAQDELARFVHTRMAEKNQLINE